MENCPTEKHWQVYRVELAGVDLQCGKFNLVDGNKSLLIFCYTSIKNTSYVYMDVYFLLPSDWIYSDRRIQT